MQPSPSARRTLFLLVPVSLFGATGAVDTAAWSGRPAAVGAAVAWLAGVFLAVPLVRSVRALRPRSRPVRLLVRAPVRSLVVATLAATTIAFFSPFVSGPLLGLVCGLMLGLALALTGRGEARTTAGGTGLGGTGLDANDGSAPRSAATTGRRMRDSNPRGVAPNTLSKRAP